ncbi:sugar ABC transporter ATP-binding protein [Pseudonocardia cypriaca]|uniref:Monosaccharide ABC transporter ATP-binding protein (CUT2 family) n=1 Tax=Pseudonocardia cypriaca TaxID=882449 RepID=A0A543FR26_9PSEU|nr:sugar ABC transporter ATP-binding protein [Pseudonocardia cypriaca]TQM36288.1 monosaccharide ABC transporter ATP-binding protein (CUT2 family) [Pseudonocardia cypriaca]
MAGDVLLRLRGVQKRYGGVRALRGVDLDVLAGEVHALVGENGAGKSTLIKIVSGAEVADEGTAEIGGTPLTGGSTQAAMEAGIATVYQEPHLFGELTVAENVFLGRELRSSGRVDWAAQRTRVSELLEQIGLDPAIGDVRVADLPVAEQQLVSIAKAFAHSAKILILDEPSAILTDREIEVLFGVVRNLRAAGVGIIYISHRLDELAQISDRVTVLRDGEVVASRPTSELTVRQVAELMVGHELGSATTDRPAPTGDPVLAVAGLGRTGAFTGLDLQVRPAEVVALYGLVGSGTDAIARALYGVSPADTGTVQVDDRAVRLHSPQDAAAAGIAMLPGNRKQQGVFANKSIAFNITSAHLRHLAKFGFWFDRRRERSIAEDFLRRISIKAPDVGTAVGALSGGNQQKVVLARQLVRAPRVLVLEEPTQGVDVGAKEEIHRLVLELADGGSAVLVISTDLPEVLQLADRVLVVRKGAVVREFGRGASQADVLAAAAGDEGEAAA